jgi:hypothetical protein
MKVISFSQIVISDFATFNQAVDEALALLETSIPFGAGMEMPTGNLSRKSFETNDTTNAHSSAILWIKLRLATRDARHAMIILVG